MGITLEVVNEKVETCKEDIKEIKEEIKDINKLYTSLELLNSAISNLASSTEKSISATNKNIDELAQLIKKNSDDLNNYKQASNEKLEENKRIIEEIKSRPEKEALSRQKFITKEIASKLIAFIISLVVLGGSFMLYQQNLKMQHQLLQLANTEGGE